MSFDDTFLIGRNRFSMVSQMGNEEARGDCCTTFDTDNDGDRVIDNDVDCSQYGGVKKLRRDTADNILGL